MVHEAIYSIRVMGCYTTEEPPRDMFQCPTLTATMQLSCHEFSESIPEQSMLRDLQNLQVPRGETTRNCKVR